MSVKVCVSNIVKNTKGEFLIIQRGPESGHHTFDWEFPTGGMETDDNTTWDAALRELKENTGLVPYYVRANEDIVVRFPNKEWLCFVVRSYVDNTDVLTLEKEKVSDYQWITLEQMKSNLFNFTDYSKDIIDNKDWIFNFKN